MFSSKMEILYDEYLKSTDIVIELDGRKFYKIIDKAKVPVKNGIVTICIPNIIFRGNKANKIVDENGKVFEFGSTVLFSFRGEIPRWYFETTTVEIKDICDKYEIGLYISIIDS